SRQQQQQQTQPDTPKPDTVDVPSRPHSTGPQLNNGALLCTSREDLIRYQALTTPGTTVESGAPQPDCHTVPQTPVQVLGRDGPSRTQVTTLGEPSQTGW